jgi:hypothetical protein
MPNAPVPANAEGMPRFNKAQIMRDAWSVYRRNWRGCRPATEALRRKEFGKALKAAWAWAKQEQMEARMSLAQKAANRVHDLTNELMRLDARPWGMRGYRWENGRSAIQAEISMLSKSASM